MDKYDIAIEYYKKNPERILPEWDLPCSNPHGILFKPLPNIDSGTTGCPTQCHPAYKWNFYMKYGVSPVYRDFLPNEIKTCLDKLISDGQIPADPEDIKVEHLPAYAEIQRLADSYQDRKVEVAGLLK